MTDQNDGRRWKATQALSGLWKSIGDFKVPDQQDRLDVAIQGQVFYCPNCGYCLAAPDAGHITCSDCHSLWWTSLGYNPSNGDVAVVKLERWR